ncbi:MAG TPA: PEP/pyruvate-binding domain-containing protein [Kofleriaceae bacterium]|nr:PEP/pyruvate-binding domain-containing protein [Kofleriaceae bacterium]
MHRPRPTAAARPLLALVGLAVAATLVGPGPAGGPAPARADEQRVWLKSIPDQATWEKYSRTLNGDQFGKFVIDVKTDAIYFFDVNLFELHADFVLGVLLKQAWTPDNIRAYNLNYERDKPRFILGYLTHHQKVDLWALSFWEGDKIDADGVQRVWNRLATTFFESKDLVYRPDSPAQEKMALGLKAKGIKVVTNDAIYKAADYQAFDRGSTVGRLRVVPVGTPYDQLTFERDDIALLQESYPDITPVAGILSTTFSTPLSHVNLRAGAWGIPNAGYKKARAEFAKLDGKMVYYEVTDAKLTLREATAAEVTEHERHKAAARTVVLPQADVTDPSLAMLTRMRARDVVKYGTKASNLGEIVHARLPDVRVPDGFGVPFFYYVRHMHQHGLDVKVDEMLKDPRFKTDAAWRKETLADLRTAIQAAPIDPDVLDVIYKRVRIKLGGKGVFVRSSTNSEDLPGFNGAGLYDTVANVRGKAALGEALKTVWASLWNLRAVEEREAFGIDHRQVYAGVLVQIGVPATAAGVLVSKNLFDPRDDDGFTINAKWGLGMKVVEGQKVPEQIIFDATNDGTRILSRSDDTTMLVFDPSGGLKEIPVPASEIILTEARAKRLVTAVKEFIPVFPAGTPLDVEWVLEGENIWIVQARPYVGK